MLETKILFGSEARNPIQIGINKACDLVKVTLGSAGRNVIISRAIQHQQGIQFFNPKVSKDGVTVLQNFHISDGIENMGAKLVIEASQKTADIVGDGTTTTAVLLQAIFNGGLKLISDGYNPMEIKKGIDAAVERVVNEIKNMSTPIAGDIEKIKFIGTVSANNDEKIGNMISSAYEKIGMEGQITIEDAKGVDTEIKITNGFEVKQGYVSQFFVTNKGKGVCELKNPVILFYENSIEKMQPLIPIIEKAAQAGNPILIFCENLEGEALATLAVNVFEKRISACVVKSPFWGAKQIDAMEDMATLTGGTFINSTLAIKLESVTLDMCGKASKVTVTKDSTLIVEGSGDETKIKELVESLREKIKDTKDPLDIKYLESRIAKLGGGIATLYVGAATETEAQEIKDRADDAVRATKAAIEEGFVVGGGAAFMKIIPVESKGRTDSFKKGTELIYSVLSEPLKQICRNAGIKYENEWWEFWKGQSILKQVSKSLSNEGYNVLTEKVENLSKKGIIDPAKVLRCSLQNAASVAGSILTCEGLIGDNIKY